MNYIEARHTTLSRASGAVKLHGPEAFEGMRKAGHLSASCLDMLIEHVKPGVKTSTLDDLAYEFVVSNGGIPATIFYRGYKYSSCISINEVVCHGMPSDRELRDGDILNIDVTAIVDGWHGDTSRMYLCGDVPLKARRLVDVTSDAMMHGIAAIKPGSRTGDLGRAIQADAEAHSYSVVRDFCGHGLGRVFHDEPNVVHFGRPATGPLLKPGMFFTVEPMVNLGKPQVKVLSDGWTAVTRDKSLSAQCEHSVGVLEDGTVEVFTASPTGLFKPQIQAD